MHGLNVAWCPARGDLMAHRRSRCVVVRVAIQSASIASGADSVRRQFGTRGAKTMRPRAKACVLHGLSRGWKCDASFFRGVHDADAARGIRRRLALPLGLWACHAPRAGPCRVRDGRA